MRTFLMKSLLLGLLGLFSLSSLTATAKNSASIHPLSACMKTAQKAAYLSDSENKKLICIEKHAPTTPQACLKATTYFVSGEAGDQARWSCLQNFNSRLKTKDCEALADKMSTPNMQARAWYYCLQEIQATPTTNECIQLAKKLYPADNLRSLQSFCSSNI